MKNIQNIVLDLGGVVIDLCRDRSVARLKEIGLSEAGEMLDLYRQRGPFLALETGACTASEFFDQVRPLCRPGTSDTDIQNAFNAFLVDLPTERLKAIRALRSAGYRVLALSNTNPVMYHSWIDRHFRAEGLAINDYFDGIVASFQEGCCKPDKRIFEILLRRYDLCPEETLFLDDGQANCEAAARLGIKTWHVTPEASLVKAAEELIQNRQK
ncbi:MAG: HAD family phosphatase [Muribaculaceae bacterium]|nr:HAD family phosphatase [Muribaculaceae bacterium]